MWSSFERTLAPMVMMRCALGDDKWAHIAAAANEAVLRTLGDGPPEIEMQAWLSVGAAR